MKFYQYLNQIRDLINWSALEKKTGIPPRTMSKHFTGNQQLPEKHIPAILAELCNTFGVVMIGEKQFSFDIGMFYWQSPIPDREVKTVEVKNGTSYHFEYLAAQYRGRSDWNDVVQLLK